MISFIKEELNMKPEKNYKNRFTKPYMMFICIVLTALTGFLGCFHTNAQDRIRTLIDSVYYVSGDIEWNSFMQENCEKIMVILNKECLLSDTDTEHVLVYRMRSANVEEIIPGIKLKPYLMIYKSEISSMDFLQEAEEEELEIEEWMYKLNYWNTNDTVRK